MSLSAEEDDLVAYGTPVDPIEEDEIPSKKPRLIEDQVVTDKQGRRRFHGAFTGGFSAGFFNTVGSLEGWSPSSFKSSKTKKQEIVPQTPQDFMDEEDMSEFGIAPVVLKAKEDYRNEGKKDINTHSQVHTLATFVLQDIIKHVRETVGIKLLKKMGWKPGQGVGPRLNKIEKKNSLKIIQKTYGCQLPPGTLVEDDIEDTSSDSEWDTVDYAPSEYEPFLCEAKSNFCGLGYEGLEKRLVLSGNLILKREEIVSQKKGMKFGSQAFGVGAFEEEDEDVYEADDMSRYNFFLGKDETSEVKQATNKNSFEVHCALEGFSSERKSYTSKKYPLPSLPKDYIPQHKIRRTRFDQPRPNNNEEDFNNFKVNYSSDKNVSERSSKEITDSIKKEEKLVKRLISNVKINENRFKPFLFNSEKQERYECYLKLIKIGKTELLSHLQPLSMLIWEKEREKLEFEKAASLFRPFTGGMEDRFSSASQPDDLSDPLATVEKYSNECDDRKKAAKLKMYGTLTRRTEDWIPDSLLCKRFNIPEPKNCHGLSSGNQKQKCRANFFDYSPTLQDNMEEMEKSEVSFDVKFNEIEPDVLQSKEENIIDKKDATDLFKAIFLASDEEYSEELSEKAKTIEEIHANNISEKIKNTQDITLYEEKLINLKRNLSPPKGIFGSVDLESLSEKKSIGKPLTEEPLKKEQGVHNKTSNLSLNLVYGPEIPEKIIVKTEVITTKVSEDDGIWVEKKHRKRRKQKKKDKKSKSSHKSKHKSKSKRWT